MMKNYFIIVVAFVAMLFVGCNQSDDCFDPNVPSVDGAKMQHFVATLGSPKADTRVAITPDDNNQVWSYEWEDGDVIFGVPLSSLSPSIDELLNLYNGTGFIPCPVSVDERGVATIELDAPVGYMSILYFAKSDINEQTLTPEEMLKSYADRQLFMVSDSFEVVEGVDILSEPIFLHHAYAVIDLNIKSSLVESVDVESISVHGVSSVDVDSIWQPVQFDADGTVSFWSDYSSKTAENEGLEIKFDSDATLTLDPQERISVPFCVSPSYLRDGIVIVYNLADGRAAATTIALTGEYEIKHGMHYTFNSVISDNSFAPVVSSGYELSDFPDSYDNLFIPSSWTIVGDAAVVLGDDYSEIKGLGMSIEAAVGRGDFVAVDFVSTRLFAADCAYCFDDVYILSLPKAIIEPGALKGYDNLVSLLVNGAYYTVDGMVLYNADKSSIHTYLASKTGTQYTAPATVTRIGDRAFQYGDNVVSATFPNVEVVGCEAFEYNRVVETVSLPNATHLGDYAFYYSRSLSSVDVPKVSYVGEYAFASSAVTSIDLPAAEKICYHAFYNSDLQTISLPSAKMIVGSAFQDCGSLTNIVVDENYFKFEDGVLYNADKTLLHTYLCSNTATSYTVPESVLTIGQSAFGNCLGLTSVSMPNVTSLEQDAFEYCDDLVSVDMPNVSSLGQYVFGYTDSLVSINLATASGVKIHNISKRAFDGCSTEKIVLTVGAANADIVDGNKLILSGGSTETFQQIIVLAE